MLDEVKKQLNELLKEIRNGNISNEDLDTLKSLLSEVRDAADDAQYESSYESSYF